MNSEQIPSKIARRYVDILTDAGFKAVFGDRRNSDVLIDLLNVILPPHRKVRSITYSSTELPQFSPFSKSVRLDLRCLGDDGTTFIVEVQCYHQANFFRRCVLYASKAFDAGSRSGDRQEYSIPPVYFIGLVAHDFQDMQKCSPEDGFVSEYTFREKTTMMVPDETIFLTFVETNRFSKPLKECRTMLEKWCYALKHVGTLDALPEELRNEVFERFFKACEIAKFKPDVKLNYENEMITETDYYNIIETARRDGLAAGLTQGKEDGRIEGIAEGEAKEKIRIAKAFKEQGVDAGIIASATGLSEKEIAAL